MKNFGRNCKRGHSSGRHSPGRLQPGENRVEVRGEKDGQVLNDNSVWHLRTMAAVRSTTSAADQPAINHEN